MLFIFILLAVATISMGQYEPPPRYIRTPLGDSIDIPTMKVLKEAYDLSADKNVVTSPLGLMILLSLYNQGAGPAASSEITQFLGGSDAKQISGSFQNLSMMFSEMDPDYLTFANKISVSDQYTLDENFASAARGYCAAFDKLDFTKPTEAASIINKWAAEKTKGHITSPVSKDVLTSDTAAVLINIIFLNGHWHVPFKAEETKEKDFHVNRDTVVKKPMMHLLKPLFYAESTELKAKMIELPYKENGFRMAVVLPDEKDGLSAVLEKAAAKGVLTDVFNLFPTEQQVDLDIPKFDVKTKLDFNKILPKVGVKKIFEEPTLGIVQNKPVKVSKAFQEASIKVNEEGATAGAFTGVVAVTRSSRSRLPTPIKFTVDHPFLYAILYEDKILFAGTYSG